MASKKRKLEEDDHNNDQVSEPITSASNTMGVIESSSRVEARMEEHREAQVQPEDSIPLGTTVVGAIHQKFDCGYAVSFKVGQQLLRGVIYHPPDKQSFSTEGLSAAMAATTSNQSCSGSLTQQGSSSNSGFNRAPLRQSRRGRPRIGSLLQPGSSSNPAFNQATSYQLLPRFGSLYQPGSISIPAFNRDAAYQLQQHHPFSPNVNQLRSVFPDSGRQWNIFSRSDEVQQNPLPPCRSTQVPHTQLMKSPFWNSKLKVLLENRERDRIFLSGVDGLIARCHSLEAELRGLKLSRLSLHPNLTVQATKSTSTNVLLTAADQGGEKRSQVQWINVELPNVMQSEPRPNPSFPMQETRKRKSEKSIASVDTLPSTGVAGFLQGGRSTSSNAFALLARDFKDGENKGDFGKRTGSGPGSTSGNITADDESNRPVVSTAGQVLSASDAESDELQGFKKNADTCQKGNTVMDHLMTRPIQVYTRRSKGSKPRVIGQEVSNNNNGQEVSNNNNGQEVSNNNKEQEDKTH